ncbi:polymer-forming cytoskeletal protein [Streptomyces noursei]|uniref:polymer-forming cytoskeletal protein n=1 Tax=Streptomyces noursei TaxID=1971 RepID=UPI001965C9D8|nr:polymer-forming cytoskeletal protein [Streptomyces noursei]QRX89943.1 polymer-forming cytoskeletal protein [Streptomyces noursei]
MTTGITGEELPPPAYALGRGGLDHALTSAPFPLQASHTTAPLNRADLDLVISAAPGEEVLCRGLVIELPMGTTAQDLVESADGISITLSDDFWNPSLETTDTAVRCLLTPQDDGFIFDEDGLTVGLRGLGINREHGNTRIRVFEDYEPLEQSTTRQPVTLVFAKAPYRPEIESGSPNRFSVHRYSGSGADTAPATLVTAGSTVTLRWQYRQGVERHLFGQYLTADYSAPGIDVSDLSRFDTEPLVRATTFTLRTRDQETGETTYDTVTVQVDEPTLAGLALTGPLSGYDGTFTLAVPVTVAGELVAQQGLEASRAFHASTAVSVTDTLTVEAGATVDGTFQADGSIEVLGDVEAQHITTGNLTAKKTVRMLGGASVPTSPGSSLTANTDGLFVGSASVPGWGVRPSFTVQVNDDQRTMRAITDDGHPSEAVFMPVLRGEKLTASGIDLGNYTPLLFVSFGS